MSELRLKPKAKHDLQDIWWFIAQDNPNNADKFIDRIYETLLVLADHPKMGVKRDEIETGIRSHVIGNYSIFYHPLEAGVEIIRILHSARDIDSFFSISG